MPKKIPREMETTEDLLVKQNSWWNTLYFPSFSKQSAWLFVEREIEILRGVSYFSISEELIHASLRSDKLSK